MRRLTIPLIALAGFGTAALTGLAIAKSGTTTLIVQKNTKDTMKSNKLENVVATKSGLPLYMLTGDTKKHHECTKANGCFPVWRPYTVSKGTKPTKASGIKGKLSVLKRNGFSQVVLGKHPLYTFLGGSDSKGVATGDGIMSFGGTWHLILDPSSGGTPSTMTSATGTTTGTTPTNPYW